jgi:hypothetical protein
MALGGNPAVSNGSLTAPRVVCIGAIRARGARSSIPERRRRSRPICSSDRHGRALLPAMLNVLFAENRVRLPSAGVRGATDRSAKSVIYAGGDHDLRHRIGTGRRRHRVSGMGAACYGRTFHASPSVPFELCRRCAQRRYRKTDEPRDVFGACANRGNNSPRGPARARNSTAGAPVV